MKEKPILFSGPMVRALLAGTKTQTRRVVKGEALRWLVDDKFTPGFVADSENRLCPYGQPGDRLWVRETWAAPHSDDGRPPRSIQCDQVSIHYAATEVRGGLLWRPSIHMPRWTSRITLEVTGVRVERLQDISDADALAEGVDRTNTSIVGYAKKRYQQLWESINGPDSWVLNPWVWVVEFKQTEGSPA